ncbi:MAG: malectin, partial [Rhodococcus sp. (in: high G+C Gram-positive bacteria)]|nr:malectin [Rhodococcus sp. (in: high G+C Gram-positive bacteria)]
MAFSALNGAINTNFAPSVSNGQVNAVEPGPIAGTVYLGGSFQGVDGVNRKIVLMNLSTGQMVPGFTGPSMDGAVNDLQLVGNRLYVGGYFKRVASSDHAGLVVLNATTGARDPFMQIQLTENHNYTGLPGQARAGVGARMIAVTPQGDQMAVIGNFRKADGIERRQMALVDLTGTTAQVRADWKTNRLAPSCFSGAFDTYVRGLDVSPDGTYFVVAATGGPNPGTLCDTVTKWEVERTGQDVQPEWIDDTGGDTLLSAVASGEAVYTGGHQRWMNNAGGRDFPTGGAVPRPGLGAVDAENGVPLAWNPGRQPRGVGAEAAKVTDSGLWIGSDTEYVGNRALRRPRIAYFPLAGGTQLGAGETGALPSNAYKIGNAPVVGTGSALYRVNTGGPALAALDGGIGWMADDGASNPYRNNGSNAAGYSADGRTTDGTVPATTPAAIFDAERWNPGGLGTMQWAFPVQSGEEVVVRLYFANRYDGTSQAGQRVFDVRIEGQTVLPSYDISADVGHNVGTTKSFTVTSDGTINIEFAHQVESPLINGIEILDSDTTGEPVEPPSGLSRVWFTGEAVEEPVVSAPAGDIDWTQVRGAVVIDGELFYGTAGSEFVRRTFDGHSYGAATVIDPYNDPLWSTVDTGSGQTFRGVRPSFYSQITSLTGMAYDDGRLYYTRSGSNRLASRAFSPDSGIIRQSAIEAPVFTSSPLGGIFFDESGENLYFVTASNGNLSRVGWSGVAAVGSPIVVSGPSIDNVDWRGRAVFLADGPQPEINQPPVAVID